MSKELRTVGLELAVNVGVPAIDHNWKWRMAASNGGQAVLPHQMGTGHLFNTLKMIWNNRMPAHMRIGHAKLYNFGSSHSDAYLMEAIAHIFTELMSRGDLTLEQVRMLEEMYNHSKSMGASDAQSLSFVPAKLR